MTSFDELTVKQARLECYMVEEGFNRYDSKYHAVKAAKGDLAQQDGEAIQIRRSVDTLSRALRLFTDSKKKANPTTYRLREILKEVDSHEAAYITIRHCFNNGYGTSSLQNISIKLGADLEAHINYVRFAEQLPGYVKMIDENLKAATQTHRHRVLTRARRYQESQGKLECVHYTKEEHLAIGSKLIHIFIETCGMFEQVELKLRNKSIMYSIKPTQEVQDWLDNTHESFGLMTPLKQPMVLSPEPWTTPYNGGYQNNELLKQDPVIRTTRGPVNARLTNNKPTLLYKGLNSIQETPWRINTKVLEVIEHFKDGDIAGIPHHDIKLMLPAPFWSSDEEYKRLQETQPERITEWKARRTEIYDLYYRDQSKRQAFLMQVHTARKFQEHGAIYFPVNCDWRTRNYPIPLFFHPQGDDVCRGMLEFFRGKTVTLAERGAYWLLVHAANCAGVDKVSFDDRAAWVRDNHKHIEACAKDPIGYLWWADKDEPFQFLAACFELAELWSTGKVDTHIPVQMDGSNNGLQHFSALTRDPKGAAAVNLIPCEKPADFYTDVLEALIPMVQKDADAEVEEARAWMKAGLTRKIAKRPSMTIFYGATQYGFADQIENEVRKLSSGAEKYLPDNILYKCTKYLAIKIKQAIQAVATRAIDVMDWMQDIARIVGKAGLPISWTTPVGVEVEQRYVKSKTKRINTFWGATRIQLAIRKETDKIYAGAMANGIAPNFVHSMDASHLILTVLEGQQRGIQDWSMIHDSFGCHASDIDTLHECLRESFIRMYSEDLLNKFREEVIAQVPAEVAEQFPPMPPLGDLNVAEVRESKYFFA